MIRNSANKLECHPEHERRIRVFSQHKDMSGFFANAWNDGVVASLLRNKHQLVDGLSTGATPMVIAPILSSRISNKPDASRIKLITSINPS